MAILAPGTYGCNFTSIILKVIIQNISLSTRCKIALGTMPQNLIIASGNGLVLPENKVLPEPTLTKICVSIITLLSHDLIKKKIHVQPWYWSANISVFRNDLKHSQNTPNCPLYHTKPFLKISRKYVHLFSVMLLTGTNSPRIYNYFPKSRWWSWTKMFPIVSCIISDLSWAFTKKRSSLVFTAMLLIDTKCPIKKIENIL